MVPRSLRQISLLLALAAALPLFSGGCGQSSTPDPAAPGAGGSSSQFFLAPEGSLAPAALGTAGTKGTAPSAAASPTTATVDGSAGAVLTAGRFRLIIPPGAFEGTQTIRLEPGTGTYVECRLYPEGLAFDVPVTLSMDLSGTTGATDRNATIYWYDPVAGSWVDVGGTYTLVDRSVSTPLEHFSDYRAGRAGW